MAEHAQGNEKLLALRESLRRADTVLNFARKVMADGGAVPEGLLEDFVDARRQIEKDFVHSFDVLDAEATKSFRDFLQATKGISQRKLEKGLTKLSRRTRSLLNRLVISEGRSPTSTGDVGVVRFHDSDPPNRPAAKADTPPAAPAPAPAATPAAPSPAPSSTSPSRSLRRTLAAVMLISVLGVVALAAAWFAGAFTSQPDDNTDDISSGNTADNTPTNEATDPPPDPDAPFDAEAAGYLVKPRLNAPAKGIDPLEQGPLVQDQLGALVLGLEELVLVIEPERVNATPDQTRARLEAFARGVVTAEPAWREARKPWLEAFIAHVQSELHLARYPAETSKSVLASDVFYSAGGAQLPLVVTVQILAHACGYATLPLAPNGPLRPELALRVKDRVLTWNGESMGLRTGNHAVLTPQQALHEFAVLLRPTMQSERGRLLADALLLRTAPQFTVENARATLADFDHTWMLKPAEGADAREQLTYRVCAMLQPVICRLLTAPDQRGTVDDALKLYRIASAAGDEIHARAAIVQLGQRADKGAMLDGQPLAYVIAEQFEKMGRRDDAITWFKRAHDEHPDDPRPTLRLADFAASAERYGLLRQAYARGERSAGFMRLLAREASNQGHGLLALAVLDELCAGAGFTALDLENAVLACIALDRTDWALTRLSQHADLVAGEPSLQRLDLICELSAHGLSARAKELATAWRSRGIKDPLLESLLQRFGG